MKEHQEEDLVINEMREVRTYIRMDSMRFNCVKRPLLPTITIFRSMVPCFTMSGGSRSMGLSGLKLGLPAKYRNVSHTDGYFSSW